MGRSSSLAENHRHDKHCLSAQVWTNGGRLDSLFAAGKNEESGRFAVMDHKTRLAGFRSMVSSILSCGSSAPSP